jgi:hypothetical protein
MRKDQIPNVILCGLLIWGILNSVLEAQGITSTPAISDHQAANEKYTLKWKFEPGEVIKVQQSIRTVYDSRNESTLQEFKYYWLVREVDVNGRASLTLVFEDATFSKSNTQTAFRAAIDEKSQQINQPNQREATIYQARTLQNSEVELVVEPNGGTEIVSGAESLPTIRSFTPGDLPGLPDRPVAIGESWKLPVGFELARGEAICTLSGIDVVDGRKIANIDCVVHWGQSVQAYQQAVNVKLEPSKIASRFDIDAGKFVKEDNGIKMTVLAPLKSGKDKLEPSKKIETLSLEMERRLADVHSAPGPKSKGGEYVLALINGDFEVVMLAGVPMRKKSDPALETSEMLHINFYHDWKDTDGDNLPAPWDLQGVNRQFKTDEKVHVLTTFLGMEKRRMRLDIVDAFGFQTYSGAIPIKSGTGSFAVREAQLPEGIYFFEFFIDNRFQLRVPVRVVSGN